MGKYFGLIHEKVGKNIGKFQHFFRQILAHVTKINELQLLRQEQFQNSQSFQRFSKVNSFTLSLKI